MMIRGIVFSLYACRRWAEIITHTPCGGNLELPAGRVHIELNIVGVPLIYDLGFPYSQAHRLEHWVGCEITAKGSMNFDIPGFTFEEDEFEEIVFYHIGHILGIG